MPFSTDGKVIVWGRQTSQCKQLQRAYTSLLRNLPNKPRSVGRDRWPPCTKFPFLEQLVSHSDPCPPKRQSLSVHHIHSNLKALRHDLWQELLNISPGTIQLSVQNRYKSHIQSGVWVQGKRTPLLPLQTPGPEKKEDALPYHVASKTWSWRWEFAGWDLEIAVVEKGKSLPCITEGGED